MAKAEQLNEDAGCFLLASVPAIHIDLPEGNANNLFI